MGKKYIIELEDEPFEKDGKKLWKSKEFASLVFDQTGLNRMTEYFEGDLKSQNHEWPHEGSSYYYIDACGNIHSDIWDDTTADQTSMSIGNVFRTLQEAEFAVEKLKVIHELKQFAEPKDAKWDGDTVHYRMYSKCPYERINFERLWSAKFNDLCFETEDDARKAVDTVGEDRIKKYYLEVPQ